MLLADMMKRYKQKSHLGQHAESIADLAGVFRSIVIQGLKKKLLKMTIVGIHKAVDPNVLEKNFKHLEDGNILKRQEASFESDILFQGNANQYDKES